MKIVFYSSNSNIFDNSTFHINTYPSVNDIFSKFSKDYTTSDFYVVTQHPCFFLPEGGDKVLVLSQDATITDIANAIIAIKPDIAVAMSFWVDPYDWLTINDSLIAEILNENEIKTISQDIKTGMTCFDKTKTALGTKKPKALSFSCVFVLSKQVMPVLISCEIVFISFSFNISAIKESFIVSQS